MIQVVGYLRRACAVDDSAIWIRSHLFIAASFCRQLHLYCCDRLERAAVLPPAIPQWVVLLTLNRPSSVPFVKGVPIITPFKRTHIRLPF